MLTFAAVMLGKYVLVGDSQLNRFARYCKLDNSLCFPGHCINELHGRLKQLSAIPSHIILLIGSNDLKRDASKSDLRGDYRALVKYVLRQVERVILLAVPIILRLAHDPSNFE